MVLLSSLREGTAFGGRHIPDQKHLSSVVKTWPLWILLMPWTWSTTEDTEGSPFPEAIFHHSPVAEMSTCVKSERRPLDMETPGELAGGESSGSWTRSSQFQLLKALRCGKQKSD